MADTLYMEDGSMEIIWESDKQEALQRIIRTHLGRDCETLYMEIINKEEPVGDDWEAIACEKDGMLCETVAALDEILEQFKKSRINRETLRTSLQRLRNDINRNI